MGKLFDAYIESFCMNTPEWAEYLAVAGDLYDSPQLQMMASFEQHLKINRLQHIRSVAYLSYLGAKKHGLSVRETARAATMHDLFYYDWRKKEASHRLHGYRHPAFALQNAYYLCGTLTKREANTIKRHMWPLTPTPPRYREGFLVSAMDKYCAFQELRYSCFAGFRRRMDALTGIGEQKQ